MKFDYLVVCGDTFNVSRGLNIEPMLKWYEDIGQYITTIVSVGNHDIKYGKEGNWLEGGTEYLEELSKIKNVNVLNNSNIVFNNINFLGITKVGGISKWIRIC